MERPVGPIRPWEVGLGSGRDPQQAHAPHPNERNPGWHPTGGRINPGRVSRLMAWPGRGPGRARTDSMSTRTEHRCKQKVGNVLKEKYSKIVMNNGPIFTSLVGAGTETGS